MHAGAVDRRTGGARTEAPIGQVCHGNYVPVHAVTLTSAYYLARYEVTQAQWVAKMGSNPSHFKELSNSPSRPVEQVSWSMVKSFASGNGLRLPTEAEWEFACKAGTTTAFYNDSNEPSALATIGWVPVNASGETHPVGGLAPNGLGFFDMVGNVWEFVSDYWGTYSANPQTNPVGPESDSQAIGRGGSYDTNNPPVYSATRSPTITTADTARILGFRVARNP